MYVSQKRLAEDPTLINNFDLYVYVLKVFLTFILEQPVLYKISLVTYLLYSKISNL